MSRYDENHGAPLLFHKIFITYKKESDMTEEDFRREFERFGEITKVHCQLDRATQKPKGYCFVHFTKTSEAMTALEEMNNQIVGDNPKPIKIHIAQDKRDNLEIDVDDDKMLHRIFIRHHKDQTKEDLEDYFSLFGEVTWIFLVKDKDSGESKGCAFIKFAKQSQAAKAMEECAASYKPRWADVRSLNDSKSRNSSKNQSGVEGAMSGSRRSSNNQMVGAMGLSGSLNNLMGGAMGLSGSLSNQMGGAMGLSGSMNNLMGGALGQNFGNMGMNMPMGAAFGNNMMGGMSMNMMPGKEFFGPKNRINTNKLEALVPAQLSQNQVYALFNIAPGLETFTLDQNSGMVKLQYSNDTCASFAKERLDGLDIFGQPIAVRVAKKTNNLELQDTATRLKQAVQNLQSQPNSAAQMQDMMESLKQVTEALARHSQDMNEPGDDEDGMERVQWCSVPLPRKQPITEFANHEAKLFIVTLPDPVPHEMLSNALCRFGNLIGCGYAPKQRYAFANYGSKKSAQDAIATLHQCKFFHNMVEFTVKVEMSKLKSRPEDRQRRDSENDAPYHKRSKYSD